jgi:proteasome beta subunit
VGSGAEIAIGLLEADYKDSLSVQEGKELALRAIKSAVSRDAASGNGADFLIITQDGVKEESVKF